MIFDCRTARALFADCHRHTRLPTADQAEIDLWRRAREGCRPRRTHPHQLQSDYNRDRSAVVDRAEFTEYTSPHRARTRAATFLYPARRGQGAY